MFAAFRYLSYRSFVNRLKEAVKSPKKLIPLLFAVVWLFGLMSGLFFGSELDPSGPSTLRAKQELYLFLYFIFQVIVFTPVFISGIFKSTISFQAADVPFLFTAPVRSQSNLIFGFLRSLPSYLLFGIFILYQSFNLRRIGFSISTIIFATLLLGWNLFATGTLSMLAYSVTKRRPGSLPLIIGISISAVVGLLIYLGTLVFWGWNGFSPEIFHRLLTNPLLRLFPLFGWASSIVFGLIKGFDIYSWLALFLTLITPFIALRLLYLSKVDYYEDAIALMRSQAGSAELKKQHFSELVRQQRVRKARNKTVKEDGIGRGWGVTVQYYRLLLEQRRLSKLPQVLVRQTFLLLMAVAYLLLYFIFPEQREIIFFVLKNFGFMILFFALGLFQLSNNSAQLIIELNQPQFYLLPIEASKLFFYSILPMLRSSALQTLPGLTALTLFAFWQVPLLGLAMGLTLALAIISLNGLFTGIQVLVFYLFGELKSALSNTLLFLGQLFAIFPLLGFSIAATFSLANSTFVGQENFLQLNYSAVPGLNLLWKYWILIIIQSLFFGLAIALGSRLLKKGK